MLHNVYLYLVLSIVNICIISWTLVWHSKQTRVRWIRTFCICPDRKSSPLISWGSLIPFAWQASSPRSLCTASKPHPIHRRSSLILSEGPKQTPRTFFSCGFAFALALLCFVLAARARMVFEFQPYFPLILEPYELQMEILRTKNNLKDYRTKAKSWKRAIWNARANAS